MSTLTLSILSYFPSSNDDFRGGISRDDSGTLPIRALDGGSGVDEEGRLQIKHQ